tara:strand:- start:365 stop:952 length:588 start_codon:yes stop_codon:yes gene_type:complete
MSTLLFIGCQDKKIEILGSSAPFRPIWTEFEFLENDEDLYFISHLTTNSNNSNRVLELALEQFEEYILEESDIIYKDYEKVIDLETKEKLQRTYVEKVFISNKSEAIMSTEYYWERQLAGSENDAPINYQLHAIITVNKAFLRKKQVRMLQIQANNATFKDNKLLYDYLKLRKDKFKDYYQTHKIKKKEYFVLTD